MTTLLSRPCESYLYVLLVGLLFGNMFFTRGSIGPISDVLEHEFDITSSEISLLSSSYYWTYVPANIPWGLFLQIYTPELALMISAFGMAATCLLFPMVTLTPNPLVFGCIVRCIEGALTSPLVLCSLTLAAHRFGNNNMGVAQGFASIVGTVLAVLGGIVQAMVYDTFQDWKSAFYTTSALSFVYGLSIAICKYSESRDESLSFKRSAETATTKTSVGESAISERERSNMRLSLWQQTVVNMKEAVKQPLNWVLGLIGVCGGVIFFGVYRLWIVPYLISKYKYSRTLASTIAGIGLAGAGAGFLVFGDIARRTKKRKVVVAACIVLNAAFLPIIYLPVLPLPVVITLSVLVGLGYGADAVLFILCREYNWASGAAETATGIVNMILMSSGFIAQSLIGFLLDLSYESRTGDHHSEQREYLPADYEAAFVVAPVAIAVMAALVATLKETNGENLGQDTKCTLKETKTHAVHMEQDSSTNTTAMPEDSSSTNTSTVPEDSIV